LEAPDTPLGAGFLDSDSSFEHGGRGDCSLAAGLARRIAVATRSAGRADPEPPGRQGVRFRIRAVGIPTLSPRSGRQDWTRADRAFATLVEPRELKAFSAHPHDF